VSLNELIRRFVRDGLNSEAEAVGLGLGSPSDQVGDDTSLRKSA